MKPVEFRHDVLISHVAPDQWHALQDDLVAGRGAASRRPDGRIFVSIDAWHDAAFDELAAAMLAALPRPLHTVVDEADLEMTAAWQRAGFTIRRREWEYAVPTEAGSALPPAGVALPPAGVALPPAGVALPPAGVAIKGFGTASVAPLRALDREIRAEAGPGWQDMPAEVVARPLDPSKYAVAADGAEYVGLLRVAMVTRLPRIGLIAVRAGHRRRGIGRALLAHTLGALHHVGKSTASAEVTESNVAATALFEGFGARRTGSNLELTRR
ncbi:GNAT family N-acetyltransferase [Actinoplanes sp. TBRC 11911]|uniref:GNAT family N-acetyltransferase n=1 Tax=Actinoplanes sp. TBRC 11911 TaxID=2729386 RepID=UPI00145CFE50|nr:GNAT family N-acetyltransferase [Actinoplanes sp. TBRC 11911]NMO53975.1 GNAT family N-acetyltransferase [Actinoplanes sp. TBRC 11911]